MKPIPGTEWRTGIEFTNWDWGKLFAEFGFGPQTSYTEASISYGATYETEMGPMGGGGMYCWKFYWN